MRHLLAAALAVMLALPAAAQDFEAGQAAYKRGDYAAALKEWLPLAEQGDASAQFNLALMYDNGVGVLQDDAEAVKWYRKAAEQGHASAQNFLGYMYSKGQGVPQDYAEAVKWYRKAAEQGDADAQTNLGYMYGKGRGVLQDYVKAHIWYSLAAAQGGDQAAKNREIVAEKMSPADVSKAQRLAREWLAKHQK